MKRETLYDILIQVLVNSAPINVFYDHFTATPNIPTIAPPFILYRQTDTSPYTADGIVFDTNTDYIVDLCVDRIEDVELLETQIETLFDTNEIVWSKSEDYLDTEHMYQIRYFI